MRLRHRLICPALLVSLLPWVAAAGEDPKVCTHASFREFDFWAGAWRVADGDGKPAGVNEITLEQGGCVLVEHWRGARGGTGQSLNYFDPVTGLWKQRWVGLGLILEMQGGLRDGAMVLEGPLHDVRANRTTLLRGTWSQLADGRVRQLFVESADQGKTWTPWFDGYYSRIPSPDAASTAPSP
jgi:hypothetical protein